MQPFAAFYEQFKKAVGLTFFTCRFAAIKNKSKRTIDVYNQF